MATTKINPMDKYFKAFIRVVKSLSNDGYSEYFGSENIVTEKLITASDTNHVKSILLKKYPQFFPENKIYSKETKDKAQFFYVVIFELYEWEKKIVIENINWECSYCGQVHENTYLSKPYKNERLFGNLLFCKSDENYCYESYKKEYYSNIELPDDEIYIKKDSPVYVYKITQKSTGKCYVGKTKNAPFFRWWNHLTHSSSPFGIYLRTTKLTDWIFEVLEILPCDTKDTDVFEIESKYILLNDSIVNGFNSLISSKTVNI